MKEVSIMIGLYDESGKLIQDRIVISHEVTRRLTKDDLIEGWRETVKELKSDFRTFMNLAQSSE